MLYRLLVGCPSDFASAGATHRFGISPAKPFRGSCVDANVGHGSSTHEARLDHIECPLRVHFIDSDVH